MDINNENLLELYVYTTPSDEKNGLLKVGHAKRGTHEKRIKDQFNASNSERPIILWHKTLPKGIKDHHIHAQMKKNGIERKEDGAGKEWFYAELKDVKKAFNEVVWGVSRSDSFNLRSEQEEAVTKAKKWFLKEHPKELIDSATYKNRFLLNAKMRFGKCFTSIHIAKSIQSKNTIIVTYKPIVINEWIETINNHVDFENFKGIRCLCNNEDINTPYLKSDGSLSQPINEPNRVYLISFQDINNDKVRLKSLLNDTKWDLLIFDEVHFGGLTPRTKKIIEDLKPKFRLALSGTPFRLIKYSDFCKEQIFTYDYLDEQENKRKEIEKDPTMNNSPVYRQMPDLDISTMKITDEDINEQVLKFKTDDMDFSLNRLFEVKNGKFINDQAVDRFLENLTKRGPESRSISIYGSLGDKLGFQDKTHSIWWLNRVNSIKCLIQKMKRHPILSQYEIINAIGGRSDKVNLAEGEIIKGKEDIEKKIKKVNEGKFNKKGTITLTCKRFLTGVTIKAWDSILVLNDTESPESYYQAIFRVQSAWYDNKILKPKAFVFDFSLSRSLRMVGELAESVSQNREQVDHVLSLEDGLGETTQKVLDDFNIKAFYEGSLNHDLVTAQQVFDAMSLPFSKIALSKRITSDAILHLESLAFIDGRVFEIIKNIKGYRSGDSGGTLTDLLNIGKEELKKERTIDEEDREKENINSIEKETNKKNKNQKKWYATQMKRLSICMADFIYMTQFREWNISHVIETKDSNFFQTVTGITKDNFKELCEKGYINKEILNDIVRKFRRQEDSSLNPEEFIESFIKKSA